MEQTFYQQIQEIIRTFSITKPEQISDVKRWYQLGAKKVRSKLKREVNLEPIFVDIEEDDTGIFQLPVFAERPAIVKYNVSGLESPLLPVASRAIWQELTGFGDQRGVPTHFRIRGDNEFEVWPRPSEAAENGLEVWYLPRQSALTADDVTTGSCTPTNGSVLVTFSQNIVTSSMVGRWFKTTDGSHEYWYRIVEYVSNNSFNLENYYAGSGGAGSSFIIGDIVDIPEQFLELPRLYAHAEYVGIYRKDRRLRNDMMAEFNATTKDMLAEYSNPGVNRVVKGTRHATLNAAMRRPLFYGEELTQP